MSQGFTVYTTKAQGDGVNWRYALTERGSGLTRQQAARLVTELRNSDDEKPICVVYGFGTFRYKIG